MTAVPAAEVECVCSNSDIPDQGVDENIPHDDRDSGRYQGAKL